MTASAWPMKRKIDSQGGPTGHLATYERLREAGTNGVQLPIKAYRDGQLIGTEMLYTDGQFDTDDGKAHFQPSPWSSFPAVLEAQKKIMPSGSTTAGRTISGNRPITLSISASARDASPWHPWKSTRRMPSS